MSLFYSLRVRERGWLVNQKLELEAVDITVPPDARLPMIQASGVHYVQFLNPESFCLDSLVCCPVGVTLDDHGLHLWPPMG